MQWSDRVGRRLKLRDLHILLAVAKSGSMGKAAAELAISQPSISKAVADVEHAVGLRLLDRGPQGIEPTMYGHALLNCGVAVFDELRRGVSELEFLANPAAGELKVGCTETMAAGFASFVIDGLSREYPRVLFHLRPADRDTLLNRELRQRTIELAIAPIAGLDLEGDMESEVLFDDQFVVMAGSRTKWVRKRNLTLADLLDEPWVLPPPESLPGQAIADAFRASGLIPPRPHVLSFSVSLHHHLLATGRFLTMLPRSTLRFGRHISLRQLAVKTPKASYPTGIITLKNRTLSPLARLFLARVRKAAGPLTKSAAH
jgi:DNA-binding transcriptional LysR family regulator